MEVKKLKRMMRVLISGLALLMVVAAVSPVMACGARRGFEIISVTSTSVSISSTPPTKTWTIGDITMGRGQTAQYAVTLNLPEETFVGTSDTTRWFILNNANHVLTLFSYNVVWSFPDAGGSFVGKMVSEVRNYPGDGPASWEFEIKYCVLRGTGAFAGQTMAFSYNGPFVGAVWTGYILKH